MTPADAIASIPVLIMSSGEGQQICHGAGIAEVDALISNSTDVYVPKSSSRLTRRIYMYRSSIWRQWLSISDEEEVQRWLGLMGVAARHCSVFRDRERKLENQGD